MAERERTRGRAEPEPTRGRGYDRGDTAEAPRGEYRGRGEPEPTRGRGREPEPERGRGREPEGRGRGTGSNFSYQRRDRADLEKQGSMGASDYDKLLKDHVQVWTPKKGQNRIRILPPTRPEPKHHGFNVFVHYGVGSDRGSYIDLDKMLGQPDPITEEAEELKRTGGATEDELKKMASKRRVGIYLIDRDDEKAGVQAYLMPWTLDKDIIALSVDPDTNEVIYVDDPDEGYDVIFTREGEKDRTQYSGVSIARRPSPLARTAEQQADWLAYAVKYPLPDQLNYYTYDEIAKAFGGGGVHRGRDDHAADGPADRGDARSGSARGSAEDGFRTAPARAGADVGGRGRGGERGRVEEPALTYEAVMQMTSAELDALCANEPGLEKIRPNDAKDDDELARWICEDLKLEERQVRDNRQAQEAQAAAAETRGRGAGNAVEDKLADMRSRRARATVPPNVGDKDVPY